MHPMIRSLPLVLLAACFGLEKPAITLNEEDGIPPIEASGEVPGLDAAVAACGEPAEAEGIEIETTAGANGCEIKLITDVEAVTAEDYEQIEDLRGIEGALDVVAVRLRVERLDLTDADSGSAVDLNSALTNVSVRVEGQEVMSSADIASIPTDVEIPGDLLDDVEASFDNREAVNLHVEIRALVPSGADIPANLAVDFYAQPEIELSLESPL